MYPFRFIVGNDLFHKLELTFHQHCVSLRMQANLLVFLGYQNKSGIYPKTIHNKER